MCGVVCVVYNVLCVARVRLRGVCTVCREVYGSACCVCCGVLKCRIISTHENGVQQEFLPSTGVGTATRRE